MKIAIVITGILKPEYIQSLIECYKNSKYTKIISTWDYTESILIKKLENHGFIVITSSYDKNIYEHSVNYQNITSKAGYVYAKSIGCSHIIRIRTDIIVSNINLLLDKYKEIYSIHKKPIFLTYFHHDKGYLSDLLYFFDIDKAIDYVTPLINSDDKRFTELFLQENFFDTNDIKSIIERVNFSIGILKNNNIEFYWIKKEYRDQGNLVDRYINVIGCEL